MPATLSALTPDTLQMLAAALFALALAHTFAARQVARLAHRFPAHAGLFHLLGEVEVVFGFWAIVLLAAGAVLQGPGQAIAYAESRSYAEPLFVFVVMVVAASRPVLQTITVVVGALARRAPVATPLATAWLGLALVPLAGSLVTEPAAMTLAALLLAVVVFRPDVPAGPKYLALGVLFVNVSIGGTLTSFAAPPVLMVAAKWGWDTPFMLMHFGWKAALAVLLNATLAAAVLAPHLRNAPDPAGLMAHSPRVPAAVCAVHIVFLAGVVWAAHHPVVFLGLFLLFLGYTQAYARHQSPLIFKEALLVACFLAGLVVLGGMQQWWLQPLVSGLSPQQLFLGATALTAATDNAALTYLGSLIEGIPFDAQYALVAGAVAGGGLTVIANAPNPAGVALLKSGFGSERVDVGGLLLGALAPTLVAMAALYFL